VVPRTCIARSVFPTNKTLRSPIAQQIVIRRVLKLKAIETAEKQKEEAICELDMLRVAWAGKQ